MFLKIEIIRSSALSSWSTQQNSNSVVYAEKHADQLRRKKQLGYRKQIARWGTAQSSW